MRSSNGHELKYLRTFAPIVSAHPWGPGGRGHTVADTLMLTMFLGLRKLGNICCGHKMFLNIFCVSDTKFVSATNVARAGIRGNICVGNNVSAAMCPRLPGPYSRHVLHERALSDKMNNYRADGRFCSFAWISRSWTFGDPFFSFQKRIVFTIISTLSKNEQKINVGS